MLSNAINPTRTRRNLLINGPGGIDSTLHIQTLITPKLPKIKSVFAPPEAHFLI